MTTLRQALGAMLLKKQQKVPAHFLTTKQWAEKEGLGRVMAQSKLNQLVAAGQFERKLFRLYAKTKGCLVHTPHYGPKKF